MRALGDQQSPLASDFDPFDPQYDKFPLALACNARVSVLAAGDVLLIPPGWAYSAYALEATDVLVATFDPQQQQQQQQEHDEANDSRPKLSWDERVDLAMKNKALGNSYFKKRDYRKDEN